MKYHIFVSATEVSADNIGASFVSTIQIAYPNTFSFSGWGGPSLKKQGVLLLGDVCHTNSVGVTEAIPFLWDRLQFLQISKSFFQKNSVDLLICIDGQGKNLPLSKIAKKLGIPIVYILPPPVFIWGTWLQKKLLHINLLICLFSQNFHILSQHHPNVILLEHPLLSVHNPSVHYSQRPTLVGLFPGSRKLEIQRLLPDMIQIFELLNQKKPNLHGVLCVAHPSFMEMIQNMIPRHLHIQISTQSAPNVLQQCKVAILASGTITLQALASATPSVVIYRLSFVSSLIAKFLLKKKFFALSNILLEKIIFPEFFNSAISHEKIAKILFPYIQGNKNNKFLIKNYQNFTKNVSTKSKDNVSLATHLIKTIESNI